MLLETFSISFDNTQNKQQYGTKITCTEIKGGGGGGGGGVMIKNVIKKSGFFGALIFSYPPPPPFLTGRAHLSNFCTNL